MDAPSTLAVNQTKPLCYAVIDLQDGKIKSTFKTRTMANGFADGLDNRYGAHRYAVKAIWEA